jgi:hypothetical protein
MAKRQSELPGTERKVIREIEAAAEKYVIVRDKRMKLTKKEVDAKEELAALMNDHNEELERNEDGDYCYRYVDGETEMICILGFAENLKVKKVQAPDPSGPIG